MKQIEASQLTKIYPLKGRIRREGGLPFCGPKRRKIALNRLTFTVEAGEAVGVLGRNGSGKSTLLKLISGITAPTSGALTVRGRLAALLELGAGFHPEYTGIENIYLNGTIHGLTRRETRALLPEILEFAGIGDYAAQPVKTYSDGMFVRLAFAAAVCVRPDILVVDEALAVGDFLFQAKCFQKLQELKAQGVTLLYVTHDVDTVRKLCTRALWLEEGNLKMDGPTAAVTSAYMESAVTGGLRPQTEPEGLRRFGSHPGAIAAVEAPQVWRWGETAAVRVRVRVPEAAVQEGLALSLAVRNREGLDLLALSTQEGEGRLIPGREQTVVFRLQSLFCPGRYTLAVGLERRDCHPIAYYDYFEGAAWFEAQASGPQFGVFHTPGEVTVYDQPTP